MTVYMTREQAEFLKRDIEASMPGYICHPTQHKMENGQEYWLVGMHPNDEPFSPIVVCLSELEDWNLFKNAALCFAKHAEMEVEEGKLEEQAAKILPDVLTMAEIKEKWGFDEEGNKVHFEPDFTL